MAFDDESGIPPEARKFTAPVGPGEGAAAVPPADQAQSTFSSPPEKDREKFSWESAREKFPDVLLGHLRNGNVDQFQELIDFVQQTWPNPPSDTEMQEILESPEAQQAAQDGMAAAFRIGSVGRAQRILELSKLPDGQFDTPAMQAAAREGMLNVLKNGNVLAAADLHEAASLPEEFWQSPDVQQAIAGRLGQRSENGGIGISTDELQNLLDANIISKDTLNTPDMQRAFETSFLQALREGYARPAVQDFMTIPEGYMERPDVRQAIVEGFDRLACGGTSQFEAAKEMATTYGLRDAEVAGSLKKAALQFVEHGYYDDISKLIDAFPAAAKEVGSPEIQAALKKTMLEKFGNPSEPVWTHTSFLDFPYLAEILRSSELRDAIQKRRR